MAPPKWFGPQLIVPVVLVGSAVGLGAFIGVRTLMYHPDLKRDSKSRRSPLLDNKEEAVAYRSHVGKIGRYTSHLRPKLNNGASQPEADGEGTASGAQPEARE